MRTTFLNDPNQIRKAPVETLLDILVLPPFDATASACQSAPDKLVAGSPHDQSRDFPTVFDNSSRISAETRRLSSNPETSEQCRIHYRTVSGSLGVPVLRLTRRWDMFQAIVGALNGESQL